MPLSFGDDDGQTGGDDTYRNELSGYYAGRGN